MPTPALIPITINCDVLEANQTSNPQLPLGYGDMIYRYPGVPTSGMWSGSFLDLMSFRSLDDVDAARSGILTQMFQQATMIADGADRGPTTVDDHDEYEFDLPYLSTSRVWFYAATGTPSGWLLIVHGGHDNHGPLHHDLVSIREDARAAGHDVAVISMPGQGPNLTPGPQGDYAGQNGLLAFHSNTPFLDRNFLSGTTIGSPFGIPQYSAQHVFHAPIFRLINEIGANYDRIAMTGLSGGGWSTNWGAALDERIVAAYSISGNGVPRFAHYTTPGDFGDVEGQVRTQLEHANFEEMQIMMCSRGRRVLHMLNDNDDCCFYDVDLEDYGPSIAYEAPRVANGRWGYYQEIADDHVWTKHARDTILADMAELARRASLVEAGTERDGGYIVRDASDLVEPTPITPELDLDDVVIWCRADYVALASTGVQTWIDKTRNGYHLFQNGTANQPQLIASDPNFNGQPSVDFDGVNHNLRFQSTTPLQAGAQAIVIARWNADPPPDANRDGLWRLGGAGAAVPRIPYNADGVIYDNFGTTVRKTTVNPATSMAQACIYSASSFAGRWANWLNGTLLYQTSSNVVGFPTIGDNANIGISDSATPRFYGQIAEIIFCTSEQTTAKMDAFITDRAARYGISL